MLKRSQTTSSGLTSPPTLRKATTLAFYKTKLCPQLQQRGKCSKGANCVFAHTEHELRCPPNLTKTKMCPRLRRGEACQLETDGCAFAHNLLELRHTDDLFKTKHCHMWKKGRCTAGDTCRHAHGTEELIRHRRIARWVASVDATSPPTAALPTAATATTSSASFLDTSGRAATATTTTTTPSASAMATTNAAAGLMTSGSGSGSNSFCSSITTAAAATATLISSGTHSTNNSVPLDTSSHACASGPTPLTSSPLMTASSMLTTAPPLHRQSEAGPIDKVVRFTPEREHRSSTLPSGFNDFSSEQEYASSTGGGEHHRSQSYPQTPTGTMLRCSIETPRLYAVDSYSCDSCHDCGCCLDGATTVSKLVSASSSSITPSRQRFLSEWTYNSLGSTATTPSSFAFPANAAEGSSSFSSCCCSTQKTAARGVQQQQQPCWTTNSPGHRQTRRVSFTTTEDDKKAPSTCPALLPSVSPDQEAALHQLQHNVDRLRREVDLIRSEMMVRELFMAMAPPQPSPPATSSSGATTLLHEAGSSPSSTTTTALVDAVVGVSSGGGGNSDDVAATTAAAAASCLASPRADDYLASSSSSSATTTATAGSTTTVVPSQSSSTVATSAASTTLRSNPVSTTAAGTHPYHQHVPTAVETGASADPAMTAATAAVVAAVSQLPTTNAILSSSHYRGQHHHLYHHHHHQIQQQQQQQHTVPPPATTLTVTSDSSGATPPQQAEDGGASSQHHSFSPPALLQRPSPGATSALPTAAAAAAAVGRIEPQAHASSRHEHSDNDALEQLILQATLGTPDADSMFLDLLKRNGSWIRGFNSWDDKSIELSQTEGTQAVVVDLKKTDSLPPTTTATTSSYHHSSCMAPEEGWGNLIGYKR